MSLTLDTTGVATANRITGEVIPVSPAVLNTFGCLYPAKGPFFGKNFVLSYTPAFPANASAVPLTLGVDYDFKFELPGFGTTPQDKVWGALNIYNQSLNGSLTVSYQSLGGNWVFDQNAIKNYLNTTQFNSNYQFMGLVSKSPLFLPNNPNAEWPLNSIESITIAQAQLPLITLAVEFLRIDGDDDGTTQVVVLDAPLPPNAAKETGGNLATIAAAQGTGATGVNPPTGGFGVLGWLSGLYALMSTLVTTLSGIATRLAASIAVTQSGLWSVTLGAGKQTVGGVYPAALAEIVDYSTTPNYVYICQADPGTVTSAAAWRIQRMNLQTGAVLWAGGVGDFSQIADNRATLSYS